MKCHHACSRIYVCMQMHPYIYSLHIPFTPAVSFIRRFSMHRWRIHVRSVLMIDRLAHCRTHRGALCVSSQASVSGLLSANSALSISTKFVQLANAPFIFGSTPEVGIVMFAPSDKAWAAAATKIGEENKCASYCSFVVMFQSNIVCCCILSYSFRTVQFNAPTWI